MAKRSGTSGELARRYALALHALADQAQALDAVATDLRGLAALMRDNRDLARLVRSPVFKLADKAKAIGAVLAAGQAHALTRRFVALVARNGRLAALGAMIGAFLAELAARRGEITAVVSSARPLAKGEADALAAALKGAGRVTIDQRVDPSLVGGLVVRLGSRMIDSSLKSKLARLQLAMKEA